MTVSSAGSGFLGTQEDIKPFIDQKFENNILLTQTERIMIGRNKLWLPSGFPFGVRRGMIGLWHMPRDTFTYYLLKVGFMPPLRAVEKGERHTLTENMERSFMPY